MRNARMNSSFAREREIPRCEKNTDLPLEKCARVARGRVRKSFFENLSLRLTTGIAKKAFVARYFHTQVGHATIEFSRLTRFYFLTN